MKALLKLPVFARVGGVLFVFCLMLMGTSLTKGTKCKVGMKSSKVQMENFADEQFAMESLTVVVVENLIV